MKNKLLILIPILLVIVIGITFAWWTWTSTNTDVTFTVEGVTVTYEAGNNITGIKLIPVSSKEKGVTDNTAISKDITVSASKTLYFDLNMNLEVFNAGLQHESLKWEIYTGNTLVNSGNFGSATQGDTIQLLHNREVGTTSTTYKLYIWIDGNQDNPTAMMNQNYKFVLNATATDEVPEECNLPNFITNNYSMDNTSSTFVSSNTGIDFTRSSSDTNGKGLYMFSSTENDFCPIYYYRGAVENNNVYFANYCWKIVRTTETGGLKMIYNGAPTNGTCGSGVESQSNSTIGNRQFNANSDDAKYVGYTYDDNGIETDSTIKGVIDTWYQNNILANYDNYIEDTVYCNDREEASASEEAELQLSDPAISKAFKPTVRFEMTGIPSLECTNNDDKYTESSSIGNGKLSYPVGLLTMDEIWIAGMSTSETNNYLNNNFPWWSLSPRNLSSDSYCVWIVHRAPVLSWHIVDYDLGVRPALSLKPGQNFEYGNGTVSNPYRFVATVPSS